MAYKIFTKEQIFKKHPVKTFFRSILPIPQKLAFAYAFNERPFTSKKEKEEKSVKELLQSPMKMWDWLASGSYDDVFRRQRESIAINQSIFESIQRKNAASFNHPEEAERRRKQSIVAGDRQLAMDNAKYYKELYKTSPSERILEREREKKQEQFDIELQKKLSYMELLINCKIIDGRNLKSSLGLEESINYAYLGIKNKDGKLKAEKLSDVLAKIDGILTVAFELEHAIGSVVFPHDYICKAIDIYSNLPDALKTDAGWKKIIDGISKDPDLTLKYGLSATSHGLINLKKIRKYFFPPFIPAKHAEYAKQKLEDSKVAAKIEEMLTKNLNPENLLSASSSEQIEAVNIYFSLPDVLKSDAARKKIISSIELSISFNLYDSIYNRNGEFIDFFLQFPPQFQSQVAWHKLIDYLVKEMSEPKKTVDSSKYFKKIPEEHFDYLWKAFITQIIQKPFEHYSFDAIAYLNNIPKKCESHALAQLDKNWEGYNPHIPDTFEKIKKLNEPYKSHILKNSLKSPDCYLKTRIAAYEILEG
ncbi:hypothetical protein COU37_03780, partial [Candidatus Micrarchaeota archaeon CG10_big_fil_rev_8_21_14_0_10_45_29]